MKKVKSIDLILENCEVISIPIDNIWRFTVGKSYIKKQLHNNKLLVFNMISDLFCMIKINDKIKNICEWADLCGKPIDRLLACNDITQIDINFDDCTKDNFYIKWWGNDQCNNEGQSISLLSDKSKLIIRIKEPEYNIKPEITD